MSNLSKFNAPKRRALLSCSVLVLAAVLPVAALAQTTVNPTQSTTYNLTPGANPIIFGGGTNVTTTNSYAVYGSNTAWSVTNQGVLSSSTGNGIWIDGGSLTLTNSGQINGQMEGVVTTTGTPALITNQIGGTISSSEVAITVNAGGAITNQSGATISGALGAIQLSPTDSTYSNTITNAGVISSSNSLATATIYVGTNSGSLSAASVVNQSGGVIQSGSIAIESQATAASSNLFTVTNAAGASITATGTAIQVIDNPVSITNAGTITTSGAFGSSAIYAAVGGTVTNTGVINGSILFGSGSSTINNSGGGQINGSVAFGGANNRLETDIGTGANPIGGITGTISGGSNSTLQLDATSNTTITSQPTLPSGFQTLVYGVGGGATLTAGSGVTLTSTVNLTALSGGGTFVNNGTITTSGAAVAAYGFNYGGVNVANNGTMTATLSPGGWAISDGTYGLGALTNTGTITAIGGGGVNAGPNYAFSNSGTLTADGTALYAFDSNVVNSGVIHSNTGVGAYLYGNVGTPATNTGVIYGQTIGAQLLGYTLTNSGVITSPGLAVSVDPYGTLINATGGTINGNVGAALYGFSFNAGVQNAGVINGNVNLGVFPSTYGSDNYYIGLAGGVLNGTLEIGTGSVTNAGTISASNGAPSIVFSGYGPSTLTLQTGSHLVGDAVGSTGAGATNALILEGTGEADNNFLNFNTLNMQGNGTWTLGGASTIGAATVSSGTLIVTGALTSTFTVNPGAILQGSSSTLLARGTLTDNGTVVFDQAADGTYAGPITGSGALVKQNTGVLVLDGVSSVATTTVNGGVLEIGDAATPGARLTSAVTVNPGGTLAGHGAIIGNVTNNGGTVSPGGTIGVLTVNGNYSQGASGALSIEVNPTQSSQLVVTGTATLAGSLVFVTDPGVYRKGTTFDFLSAGSVTGGFSSVTATNGMGVSAAVQAGEVVATVTQGMVPLASGATPNERAVANAFGNYPVGTSDFDPVANAVINLGAGAQQNAAFDRLGGEVYADLLAAGRDSARGFLGGLSDQLHADASAGAGAGPTAVWARAFGSFGSVDADGNAHAYSSNAGGAIFGVEQRFGAGTVLGAAATYRRTDLSLKGLSQTGDLTTGAGALYGAQSFGAVFVDAAVSYDYDHGQGQRTIALPGIDRKASSGFSGDAVGGLVEAGVRFDRAGFLWEPSVGLLYSQVRQDGFTESGAGGADLAVKSQSLNAYESLAGVRFSRTLPTGAGAWKFDGRLAWAHELGDVNPVIGESFAAASGTNLALAGAKLGADSAVLGAGLSYARTQNLSFYARYDGQLSQQQIQNAVTLGARFAW